MSFLLHRSRLAENNERVNEWLGQLLAPDKHEQALQSLSSFVPTSALVRLRACFILQAETTSPFLSKEEKEHLFSIFFLQMDFFLRTLTEICEISTSLKEIWEIADACKAFHQWACAFLPSEVHESKEQQPHSAEMTAFLERVHTHLKALPPPDFLERVLLWLKKHAIRPQEVPEAKPLQEVPETEFPEKASELPSLEEASETEATEKSSSTETQKSLNAFSHLLWSYVENSRAPFLVEGWIKIHSFLQHAHRPTEKKQREGEIKELRQRFEEVSSDGVGNELSTFAQAWERYPERRHEWLAFLLSMNDPKSRQRGLAIFQNLPLPQRQRLLLMALAYFQGSYVGEVFTAFAEGELLPARVLLERIQRLKNYTVRESLLAALFEREDFVLGANCVEPLTQIVFEIDDLRERALERLEELDPDAVQAVWLALLKHPDANVRMKALEQQSLQLENRLIFGKLLEMTRDPASEIRLAVLASLAPVMDIRVFGEMVSCLDDVEKEVRNKVQELLEQYEVASLALVPPQIDGLKPWEGLRKRVNEIRGWGRQQGWRLLGRRVDIYPYRAGLGRTWGPTRRGAVIIEISDTPVTQLHPHGEELMKGLILHEIGHHLFDFGQPAAEWAFKRARAEGLAELFNIVLDERLERGLRSMDPEWARYIDRLNSYAFAQEEKLIPLSEYAKLLEMEPLACQLALEQRTIPGSFSLSSKESDLLVRLSPKDLFAIPNAMTPFQAFLCSFVGPFDPSLHPNPVVQEAVALVPRNLRDLNHREILELCRQLADLLGTDKENKKRLNEQRQRFQQLQQLREMLEDFERRLDEAGRLNEARNVFWQSAQRQEEQKEGQEEGPGYTRLSSEEIDNQAARNALIVPQGTTIIDRIRRTKSPQGGLPANIHVINLAKELDFAALKKKIRLDVDHEKNQALVASVRKHIRLLRPYFEKLGKKLIEEYASRQGKRLDIVQARRLAYAPVSNLLVSVREEKAPDLYLGLLIDRSGSMDGEKIERAKAFATLIVESAKGLRGIEGHVSAFDDDTFFELGTFQHHSIGSLETGGANNDSGGLHQAAMLALQSNKKNRIVVMLSDGMPTHCSFASLEALVKKLSKQYGILCAQVAVDHIEQIAFPHYVDLSQYDFHESVAHFGRLLIQLTQRATHSKK